MPDPNQHAYGVQVAPSKKSNAGLWIVLGVVGGVVLIFLVGIALTAFVGYQQYSEKAKAAEAHVGIASIKSLIESQYIETNTVPTSTAELPGGKTAFAGKYYSDYTWTGGCDPVSGRFLGVIKAIPRPDSKAPEVSVDYSQDQPVESRSP